VRGLLTAEGRESVRVEECACECVCECSARGLSPTLTSLLTPLEEELLTMGGSD
jgi:hypothetical protein